MKAEVKVNLYTILAAALEGAVISGMNKADKYSDVALTEVQRGLLLQHIPNYFWLNVEEAGLEFE